LFLNTLNLCSSTRWEIKFQEEIKRRLNSEMSVNIQFGVFLSSHLICFILCSLPQILLGWSNRWILHKREIRGQWWTVVNTVMNLGYHKRRQVASAEWLPASESFCFVKSDERFWKRWRFRNSTPTL
jgi:hypothetical protein